MVRRTLADFGFDPAYYWLDSVGRLHERAPTHCPVRHRMRAGGGVTVGAQPCLCKGGHAHRTWQCACGEVWVYPGCTERPQWRPWLGDPPSDGPTRFT